MPLTRRTAALVEERVEAQRDPELLHLLVDLGALDLARAGVVDDLHARPLFHVEDHALADDAVVVGLVDDLDPQVVEEVGAPQPPEVVAQLLLGGLVVGHPDAVGAAARLRLDVIEVGLRVDQRLVDRVEAELEEADDRPGAGGRHPRGGLRAAGAAGAGSGDAGRGLAGRGRRGRTTSSADEQLRGEAFASFSRRRAPLRRRRRSTLARVGAGTEPADPTGIRRRWKADGRPRPARRAPRPPGRPARRPRGRPRSRRRAAGRG